MRFEWYGTVPLIVVVAILPTESPLPPAFIEIERLAGISLS
jgi:hypothetical protein